jgi:hypothetical protein
MSIHIGGCHRLPMTEVPDFMLKIPKHPFRGQPIHRREPAPRGGPEADCPGKYEIGLDRACSPLARRPADKFLELITSAAIRAAGGASATHGDLAVTSKNTDPDSCTAERTSDSASVLIDTTPRITTASSAIRPDPRARSQIGRATTIAGPPVRARGPVNKEPHERSRWLTPAALICDLPMRYAQEISICWDALASVML